MITSQQFTVKPADAGARLDKFLTTQLKDITRSQIQKFIKTGGVTVNGKTASVHQFLKTADIVAVSSSLTRSVTDHPLPQGRGVRGEGPPAPTIVYEDGDLVAIDKPAGLLVHPTDKQEPQTLTAWLLDRYPTLHEVGEPHRPGIVHRLDRDVSGLMVVAKTPAAYQHLVEQFSQRRVHKTYAAVVYGMLNHSSGEITLPIGRSTTGKFVAHPANDASVATERDARTAYRVLTPADPYCLLEVKTTTGRPHQIRAHLAAIGHPIIGDREYGPSKPFHHTGKRKIKVVTLDRILLHVTGLQFTGPNGKLHTFTSSVPELFTEFMQKP